MTEQQHKGLIAYFARTPVAANLMMMFIVIMGAVSYTSIQRQMFPNIEINYINITASYPGASVLDIEENIIIKIEDALKDVNGIKKVVSEAKRSRARMSLEIDKKLDLDDTLIKIKEKVDAISDFPDDMKPLNVRTFEFKQDVLQLVLVGNRTVEELAPLARKIGDEIRNLPPVSTVNVWTPTPEIAIEVSPDNLRKYNLTIQQVKNAIQSHSLSISAGQVNTAKGIIFVRIEKQAKLGDTFSRLPIITGNNGATVRLGDIAKIKDGFTERERYVKYSGMNAISLSVKATKNENMVDIAESVNKYLEEKQLPAGVRIETIVDMTYYLNARLDMMLKNLLQGAILVALLLGIFLRVKLAFWVMMGLPVAFLGAVMLMPVMGVSINVVTLFSFIMVLGIVVDDAIVIGESASVEIEKHGGGVDNVIRGAQRVATPATFGVLTTIAVFSPFLFSSGGNSAFFFGIAAVAILCLAFSLVESKLILPAHLAHVRFSDVSETSWRFKFNRHFFGFVNGTYKRFLTLCLRWRWSVLCIFIGLLVLSVGLVKGGFIRTTLVPKVPHDFPVINITMGNSTASEQTVNAIKTVVGVIEQVDKDVEKETGLKSIQDLLAFNRSDTEATIVVKLADENERPLNAFEISRRWRDIMPAMPGVQSLVIKDTVNARGETGDDFGFLLFSNDIAEVSRAGRYLMEQLSGKEGIYDLSSTIDLNSQELRLSLKPVAYDLGLTLKAVGQQLSEGFYGTEVQKVLRDGEEVAVKVRYPRNIRDSIASLQYAVITTPAGSQVMLGDIANVSMVPGTSEIRRENRRRGVYVYGSIDEEIVEPDDVIESMKNNQLKDLQRRFSNTTIELSGAVEEERKERNEQLGFFIAALILVYILLAVPLNSYWQPLIIMSVIPFSFIGAIWAHFAFNVDISMTSSLVWLRRRVLLSTTP
nr:efflux RND transporter permease subunit [Veronia nyctiphanis]